MRSVAGILIALWAGSLWTVCGIVAPTLFAMLDRAAAGQLAARFFLLESVGGAVIALLLWGLRASGALVLTRRAGILIGVIAGAPLLSELALGPLMDQARAAGNMARFGMLHGVAGALFLVACAGAVALAWDFNRRAE